MENQYDESRLRELISANGGPAGLDLSGTTITGNFDAWDLSNCNFRGADLRGCRFRGTWLNRSDFREADLTGVNLSHAHLRHANLTSADLPQAMFWRADLRGARLFDADCQRAIFEQVSLRRANLRNASLQDTNFSDSDLRGADLRDSNLQGANLSKAKLQRAMLENANLLNANLEGADLQHANLYDTNLQNSNLEDANLTGADLRIANLMNANLEGAELKDSEIVGTNLQGVNWGSAGVLAALKEGDFETAAKINRSLSIWHRESGDYNAAGNHYYWEMNAQRLQALWGGRKENQPTWRYFRWLRPADLFRYYYLLPLWIFTGYGERVLRVVASVLLLIVLPGIIYFGFEAFSGGDFVSSMYYSAASATALGYGSWVNPEPALWARIFGVFQTLMGVPLLGLFLVTVTRRIIR